MTRKATRPTAVPTYKTDRDKAWRNAMVAAINAGLQQNLFTLVPGDNRWPVTSDSDERRKRRCVFRFDIGEVPAIGYVSDAGYDELSIHVALWPTKDGDRWVECWNADFAAGDVFASGWLERRDGAWLQTPIDVSRTSLACRKEKLSVVAALNVEPNGFADRGRFVL